MRIPEPRGATHAGRVAVLVTQQSSIDVIREDMCCQQLRHREVQPLDVGEAASENDHVRVENIDHQGQRLCQASFIAAETRLADTIARIGSGSDFLRGD